MISERANSSDENKSQPTKEILSIPWRFLFDEIIPPSPKVQWNSVCTNCGTDQTIIWHKGQDGKSLCNQCSLYYDKHGSHRPPENKIVVGRSVNPRDRTYSITTVSSYPSEDENSTSSQVPSPLGTPILGPRIQGQPRIPSM